MRSRKATVACIAAAALLILGALWVFAPGSAARAQDEGPTPNSGSGETVYAPKKQQQPAPQPSEQPAQPPPQQPQQQQQQKQQQQQAKPENNKQSQIYTLSTQSNLVDVNVLVTDKNGDPIGGLRKENFKVLDDGVSQNITNFSTAEAPLTMCMLIEFSNTYWALLYLALEDSYQFLNFIEPKDWVAVIDFDMRPHILQDFTHNRSQVQGALDSMRLPGFSEINLYDALAFTLDRMKNIKGRKAILLICTGLDTFSKLTYGQMLKIVKGSNTPIYPVSILEWLTVRYGEDIASLQARNALTTFAKYSGGSAYFPRFEGAIPGVYQQIAGQLRHEYSLGFVPSNSDKDGKYHKLDVKLVDGQGNPLTVTNKKGKKIKYKVIARDGYYASK